MLLKQKLATMSETNAQAFVLALASDAIAASKESREAANEWLDRKVEPSKARDSAAERVKAAHDDVMSIAGTSRSFYALRAARCRVLASELAEALRNADRIRKSNGGRLATSLDALAAYHDNVMPLLAQLQAVRQQKWQPDRAMVGAKTTRQRHKLGHLPADWRERIWSRMKGGKYASAVALAMLTGLRPAEVEGAVITRTKDGLLSVGIYGAKHKDADDAGRKEQGQKRRGLVLQPHVADCAAREAFDHLLSLAAAASAGVPVRPCAGMQAAAVSSAFRAASRREFGVNAPSFYVLRHAFASELKAEGHDEATIAVAMGHAAAGTQQHYGQGQQASGGGSGLVKARGEIAVRQSKPKPPPPSHARQAAHRSRSSAAPPPRPR